LICRPSLAALSGRHWASRL